MDLPRCRSRSFRGSGVERDDLPVPLDVEGASFIDGGGGAHILY